MWQHLTCWRWPRWSAGPWTGGWSGAGRGWRRGCRHTRGRCHQTKEWTSPGHPILLAKSARNMIKCNFLLCLSNFHLKFCRYCQFRCWEAKIIVDKNKNNDGNDHAIVCHQRSDLDIKFQLSTNIYHKISSVRANYLGREVWGKLEPFKRRT